jgi:hypothetical protein
MASTGRSARVVGDASTRLLGAVRRVVAPREAFAGSRPPASLTIYHGSAATPREPARLVDRARAARRALATRR